MQNSNKSQKTPNFPQKSPNFVFHSPVLVNRKLHCKIVGATNPFSLRERNPCSLPHTSKMHLNFCTDVFDPFQNHCTLNDPWSNYSSLCIECNIPLDIHRPGRRNHTSQESGSSLWKMVFSHEYLKQKPDTLQNEADAALDCIRAEVNPISEPPAEKFHILKCSPRNTMFCY